MSQSKVLVRERLNTLKQDEQLRQELLEILKPDRFVKRDELTELLSELKAQREEWNKRFEAMDKRFEAMQKQMNERFEAMDKRFEKLIKKMDEKFDTVFERLNDMSKLLNHGFERFNRTWLKDLIQAEGLECKKLQTSCHFIDDDYEVFPDTKTVEVDIYCEKPLIVGEVTAFTRELKKVTVFLRKVAFLEKRLGTKAAKKFYITYKFEDEIKDEALRLLKEHDVVVYSRPESQEEPFDEKQVKKSS